MIINQPINQQAHGDKALNDRKSVDPSHQFSPCVAEHKNNPQGGKIYIS